MRKFEIILHTLGFREGGSQVAKARDQNLIKQSRISSSRLSS